MPAKADHIAVAERHVRDGLAIVARQRDLIERLRCLGHSTDVSEGLLVQFERSQSIFEDDLRRLQRELGRP